MALPRVGNGYQFTDGNLNEVILGVQGEPATATSTATLTALQLTANLLVANPSTTAASYTLPTVAALETLIDTQKAGATFRLEIVNLGTASGAVTILTNTGWTLVGNMVIAVTTSAQFLARKTGTGTWTLYRVT